MRIELFAGLSFFANVLLIGTLLLTWGLLG